MAILKREVIGNQTLLLGDCLQVMPLLGRFDAVVTDPPYGINYSGQKESIKRNGSKGAWRIHHEEKGWDKVPPAPEAFAAILESGERAIIWGGNYFADRLPVSRGWLVWYKAQTGLSMSDAELAWTNCDMVLRLVEMHRGAMWRDGSQHPTQKPVALMEWCLGFLPDAKTILDPYAGSGTVSVACQRMGRFSTSIEIDPDYFQIMCKRVDEAARQPDLLIPETRQAPVQEGFDL